MSRHRKKKTVSNIARFYKNHAIIIVILLSTHYRQKILKNRRQKTI